ncbi:hypothetical protein COW99_01010 [Candidatus Roizmanbacteria bacterium CG22_combo_CG10-13_8_21_14_all_38_20]|uniref:Uncharacterized protein n=1 Tax=Candidatus Roizmanbacteria bacterium CG22_combo_CG10-13_8_21_14_all_38_20 TaxID=1974862 RepID=A0A2H0BWE6_9BACT|nr:hypothetical protein [Candidatus Microgenomates bacterium]PIP61961.1 MAG: hypothetical protein COW99_01010 [Candidatus Roizmanbacteria bacterium CG22_combo_CG10-13_8_21_14_all_38_20]PJC31899.1 MAG: hypothetical protein CO050_01665 [Candidatus Roizmanbacteria bacterium CG_4_9_14_0_2_um_filter_38_17]
MASNLFEKDIERELNKVHNLIPLPAKYKSIGILIGFILFTILKFFNPQEISNNKKEINQSSVLGDNNFITYNQNVTPMPSPNITENNCYVDSWIPFDAHNWIGLNYLFNEINGIYSPKKVGGDTIIIDSVASYNKPCKGPVDFKIKFIPRSNKLINLNLYYGTWFRWEIGGNDLRSVRLYKNEDGCSTAFKGIDSVEIPNTYLTNMDRFTTGEPITATMFVYLTKKGTLKTELLFAYKSAITRENISVTGRFFHEFDVSDSCSKNNELLDITKDSQLIGVGLMPSKGQFSHLGELPKVEFIEFTVAKP